MGSGLTQTQKAFSVGAGPHFHILNMDGVAAAHLLLCHLLVTADWSGSDHPTCEPRRARPSLNHYAVNYDVVVIVVPRHH